MQLSELTHDQLLPAPFPDGYGKRTWRRGCVMVSEASLNRHRDETVVAKLFLLMEQLQERRGACLQARVGEGRGNAAGRSRKGVVWLGAAVQEMVERSCDIFWLGTLQCARIERLIYLSELSRVYIRSVRKGRNASHD
jgi:hypothetical protein